MSPNACNRRCNHGKKLQVRPGVLQADNNNNHNTVRNSVAGGDSAMGDRGWLTGVNVNVTFTFTWYTAFDVATMLLPSCALFLITPRSLW